MAQGEDVARMNPEHSGMDSGDKCGSPAITSGFQSLKSRKSGSS